MEKRRRVLLLDTDPDTLIMLQHALEEANIDATVTWDENEACQLIGTARFDLILVGDHPPELNGAAIINDLSLRGTCPPVLILRGAFGEKDGEYFRQLGAIGLVPKRDPRAVVEQVTNALVPVQLKVNATKAGRTAGGHGKPSHKPLDLATLDKCANPACSATFLRLRDGKLFVAEVEVEDNSCVSKHRRQIEYFWLCNSCCRSMTIAVKKGKRAQVISLPESVTATPAAS